MMLRYVGLGERQLGDHPMPAHPRLNWEFLAVVRGKLAPFEKTRKGVKPVTDRLWLFPPGVVHGWVGEPGKTCDILVLHFSSVPHTIEQIGMKHRCLQTSLSPADLRNMAKLAPVFQQHYWDPTVESEIRAQHALLDLCLLVLREYEERSSKQAVGGSYNRVVRAEEWLRHRLAENPSVKAAAQHVGLSPSQLGRLFLQIRKETPQDYLNRIKIDRAMELLGYSNAKLEKVAIECGFSSASNLCRAFKAAKGMSPHRVAQRSLHTVSATASGSRFRLQAVRRACASGIVDHMLMVPPPAHARSLSTSWSLFDDYSHVFLTSESEAIDIILSQFAHR